MYKRKSSAELKGLAKEQLGNYGVIVGSFAIMFAIFYAVFMIVYGIMFIGMFSSVLLAPEDAISTSIIVSFLIFFVVILIVTAIFFVLEVSIFYMVLRVSRHEPIAIKDMFYCFKHHPDKVIVIYFLQFLLGLAVSLPTIIFQFVYMFGDTSISETTYILVYCVLYVITMFFSVFIGLIYGFAYFFYIDNPEMSAIECMRQSRIAMRGNKGRMFYIYVSFLGWCMLSMLTCGLGFLWLVPYMLTVLANFYQDVLAEHNQSSMNDSSANYVTSATSSNTDFSYDDTNNPY